MLFMYRPVTRIVAICLVLAVTRADVLAGPALPPHNEGMAQARASGQIMARIIIPEKPGKNPVTVNGDVARTGAAILTDSRIQTPDDVGATIILDDLATVEIGPNTDLVLDFSSGRLKLNILRGCVKTLIKEGVAYSETTPMGEPVQKQKDVNSICVGAAAIAAAAGTAGAGTDGAGTGGGPFGFSMAAILAAIAGVIVVVTAAVLGTRDEADETPPVVSPMR